MGSFLLTRHPAFTTPPSNSGPPQPGRLLPPPRPSNRRLTMGRLTVKVKGGRVATAATPTPGVGASTGVDGDGGAGTRWW